MAVVNITDKGISYAHGYRDAALDVIEAMKQRNIPLPQGAEHCDVPYLLNWMFQRLHDCPELVR